MLATMSRRNVSFMEEKPAYEYFVTVHTGAGEHGLTISEAEKLYASLESALLSARKLRIEDEEQAQRTTAKCQNGNDTTSAV